MALIPNSVATIGENVEIVSQPTYTYYLDFAYNKIVRFTDGKEAIKQAILMILQVERYAYLIYDWNYGVEIEDLIGKDPLFVLAEIERRITEALLQDDRIISLSDFVVNQINDNDFVISFTANTTEGDVDIGGVNISV